MRLFKVLLVFVLFVNQNVFSQSLEKEAKEKITRLNKLIKKIDKKGIDTHTEQLAVRVAEVFLKFADWDENHTELNKEYYSKFSFYRENADKMALDLANFERKDVNKLLENTIDNAKLILAGKIKREGISPKVEWKNVSLKNDYLEYKGKPVFLSDYTWKPDVKSLEEFFGQQEVFLLSPRYVQNKNGVLSKYILDKADTVDGNRLGFVFIDCKQLPKWAEEEYGKDINSFGGEPFNHFDIDNPGTREVYKLLFKGIIPKIAGKNYTNLGYMLANEPRWITYKNGRKKVWYNTKVSNYTIVKYKTWLENKHKTIKELNSLWQTDFASFDAVSIENPIDLSNIGSAQWYDWNTFNDERVLEWFTFMKTEIQKYDQNAKVHMKIMPSFFTENSLATGIDLEALTEISEIIGNDAAAPYNDNRGEKHEHWKNYYTFKWREMYMGYDFLKSVSPDKLMFNSESHFLSTSHSRDLYQKPAHARATYWAAHTLGLDVSQTWYWPRRKDGSLRQPVSGGYAGSNNQQPALTNELQSTIIDLNRFSDKILGFQRQRKPIRFFYSKTSAHQKKSYMDELFHIYESLSFEGVSLGFATEKIINKQDFKLWDVVIVTNTPRVTNEELMSLQNYLDKGGKVIVDNKSLLENEYGLPITKLLASKGDLINITSLTEIKEKALEIVENKGGLPKIRISELNTLNRKVCAWKYQEVDGKLYVSILNLGKVKSTIQISSAIGKKKIRCKDLLKGVSIGSKIDLKPYDVYLLEIKL